MKSSWPKRASITSFTWRKWSRGREFLGPQFTSVNCLRQLPLEREPLCYTMREDSLPLQREGDHEVVEEFLICI